MSHTTSSTRRAAAAAPAPGDDLIPGGNLPAPPPGASDDPGGPAAPRFFRRGILAAAAGHPSRLLPLRRARAWRRWALAGSAAALAALVLLLPAQTKESTAPAPALSQDAVSQVIPTSAGLAALYDLAYLENLAPPLPARTWRTFPFSSPETPPRAIFPLTQRTKPNLSFFWRTLPFPRPPSPRILFKTSRQSPPHRKRLERFSVHSFHKSKEDAPQGASSLLPLVWRFFL
ncbi:MAG: hypothetical protein ACLR1T_13080 [Evtepia gabavorous]